MLCNDTTINIGTFNFRMTRSIDHELIGNT